MMLILLILIPLLAGIFSFLVKGNNAKVLAFVSGVATLCAAVSVAFDSANGLINFSASWIPQLGTRFMLQGDGMSAMLCLLVGIVMPLIFIANWHKEVERPHAFYGLMLLSQAGITGVFLANDALLFYVFWELALIPVYFLCSQWGGEKRIAVTYKFFVYTFVGSLMMLGALIYLGTQTVGGDAFSWFNITNAGAKLPVGTQQVLFWFIFIAFAVKMPLFPFHTWQPDTYEQAPTSVTIILSALMVKMGLFATIKWLLPVLPSGVAFWSNTIIILSIIGIVYASCVAIVQTDLKKLVAYSSIAHMGLMCAAAFSVTSIEGHQEINTAMHGVMVQMFNHGINITGMWLLVAMIDQRYGTKDMRKLGGLATVAPQMSIALLIVALANIGLPLTNGFVGEFMLFNGVFEGASAYSMVFMAIAGLGIILGAVYTLNMVQKTAYGEKGIMEDTTDMNIGESIAMAVVIALILFIGIYPKPLLELTQALVY